MSVYELLKQRWKVVGDYPNSAYNIGEIIHIDSLPLPRTGQELFNKYPHLFKSLQWWEERKPKDMPEYIKGLDGKVYEVFEYRDRNSVARIMDDFWKTKIWQQLGEPFWMPATNEEYESYINPSK